MGGVSLSRNSSPTSIYLGELAQVGSNDLVVEDEGRTRYGSSSTQEIHPQTTTSSSINPNGRSYLEFSRPWATQHQPFPIQFPGLLACHICFLLSELVSGAFRSWGRCHLPAMMVMPCRTELDWKLGSDALPPRPYICRRRRSLPRRPKTGLETAVKPSARPRHSQLQPDSDL